jgi:hypothetical protein
VIAHSRATRRARLALLLGGVALALAPLVVYVLFRMSVIVPAETSLDLGPVRLATTCYSRKVFCFPHENTNPPPRELFVLIDWPGGDRREDVLLLLPLR